MTLPPTLLRHYLSSDRRVLVAEWEHPEGILTARLEWLRPATDEEVTAALQTSVVDHIAVGERRTARRIVRGGWTLWLHRMSGPPTWWAPRLFGHQGALIVGWLRLAFAVKVERTPVR